MTPWLHVIGIGEDGLDGISARARALIDRAEVLVGGARHLAKVPRGTAERIDWAELGFAGTVDRLPAYRGRRVVVLASGDPLHYGAGVTIARRFPPDEIETIPIAGAFSLAAARLAWPLADLETLTLHGRPLALLHRHIAPGRRLLVLSEDGATPAQVARLLVERGFGPSAMTVLEHMGGADERRSDGTAETWAHARVADLNTLAIECRAGPQAHVWSRAAGLPDDAFRHDGQITKREVRAATLARLAPLPEQVLWDVGAGCGSVAIEWLRAELSARAVALERDAKRVELIRANADALGVPLLRIVAGEAPACLAGQSPAPDAVFVGGGVAEPEMLKTCWAALKPGGRLVANAVTLTAEAALIAFHGAHGGELARISVARAGPIGGAEAMAPLRTVTQLCAVKEPR